MLRQIAGRSQELSRLAARGLGSSRNACTSAAADGSSISSLISAIKASSPSTYSSGGLAALKASITPSYAAPAGSSAGMSTSLKLVIGAAGGWALYRLDQQARSKDWIVDLSLETLPSLAPFYKLISSLISAIKASSPSTYSSGGMASLKASITPSYAALDVLQAAWWISYASFIPFRSVFFSLRGAAPHTGTTLAALRPAVYLK